MIVLLVFYGVFVLIVITAAALVFRSHSKKRGTSRALLASGLTVVLLGLFFPIPVHGGFTFPIEIMLHELRSGRRLAEQEVRNESKEAFRKKLAARFQGPLVMSVREQVTDQFSSITTQGGTPGWFATRSGLAWTDMLPLDIGSAAPDLERAKAFCAQIEPRGFWGLPTEAELSLFWKAGGYDVSPLSDYGTVSLLENIDLQTEMSSVRTSRSGAYALRCVALGPGAPVTGYLSADIPLPDWNGYQVQKTIPGFPGPPKP